MFFLQIKNSERNPNLTKLKMLPRYGLSFANAFLKLAFLKSQEESFVSTEEPLVCTPQCVSIGRFMVCWHVLFGFPGLGPVSINFWSCFHRSYSSFTYGDIFNWMGASVSFQNFAAINIKLNIPANELLSSYFSQRPFSVGLKRHLDRVTYQLS